MRPDIPEHHLWAVDDLHGSNLLGEFRSMRAGEGGIERECATSRLPGDPTDGGSIVVIDIEGLLSKRGFFGTSMPRVAEQLRAASTDDTVGAIILRFDSPGGTVAGLFDLAAEIEAANKQKPVVGFAADLCASAAYLLASQTRRLVANNNSALVGSIGTFLGLYDLSGFFEEAKIRAVVIKAGEFKGTGMPGTEITEAQVEMLQGLVDETQGLFNERLAAGRGLEKAAAEKLADGRIHMARAALKLKLIDGVQPFNQVVEELRQQLATRGSPSARRSAAASGGLNMSDDKGPKVATIQELKAACPGADSDFLCKQLEAGATVEHATAAWTAEQGRRLESANQELEQTKKENAKLKAAQATGGAKPPGMKPFPEASGKGATGAGDFEGMSSSAVPAALEWQQKVAKKCEAGMKRQEAVAAVVRENPELHQRYLEEHNELHRRPVPSVS